ncbi:MAG: efflux RND transporter periplasmic adaptor subunit [Verrucomicrobiota bacterium]
MNPSFLLSKHKSSRRIPASFPRLAGLTVMAVMLLTGCGKKPAGPPAGQAGPAGPVEAGVLTIATETVTFTQDLPGRTSAFRVAEVRARVNGIVLRRLFKEGTDVAEGELLYEIDPAPYQAALDNALGTLARAQANVVTARAKEQRYKQLVGARAISRQEYDDSVANQRGYEADITAGEAAVQSAKINLGYTKVTSPVAGRIGISQVTEGAYVQESAATLLATVQQLDRVYVDVTQASSEFLRLKEDLAAGKLKADAAGQAKVRLIREDGRIYPEEGTLSVADVSVNPTTNTVTVRAIFPNPRGELLPGLFVRARLEEGSSPDAILVPQFAVTRNSKGQATALVVGPEGLAEVRVLETARSVGNRWLVTAGLKPGDRVIVDNLQHIRPGASVKAVAPAAPPQPAATASISVKH